MDIGDWLRSLGLERYADAFRESDIGIDVVPELTDADLRELGVSLGDRRRLLKSALNLRPEVHDPVPTGAAPEERQEPPPARPTFRFPLPKNKAPSHGDGALPKLRFKSRELVPARIAHLILDVAHILVAQAAGNSGLFRFR